MIWLRARRHRDRAFDERRRSAFVSPASAIAVAASTAAAEPRSLASGLFLIALLRSIEPRVIDNTLVCAGAELANSIAFGKKRWRVVTTEGVVINTSGTMEGGGKPLSGRMGSAPVAATGASDADVALTWHVPRR